MTEPTAPAPPPVQHVREQQFVATCDQCKTPARGAFHEFVEGGWVFQDGARHGRDGMVPFCPGCVFGLAKVAAP